MIYEDNIRVKCQRLHAIIFIVKNGYICVAKIQQVLLIDVQREHATVQQENLKMFFGYHPTIFEE